MARMRVGGRRGHAMARVRSRRGRRRGLVMLVLAGGEEEKQQHHAPSPSI